MKLPKPTVENLLSLARYGGKNRLRAAKEIANLDPDTDINRLMWLIEELASDPEDPIFSEVGISLSKLIEKMDQDELDQLIEQLLSTHNGRLLLGIMLSVTRREMDLDLISEIIRRLLNDPSEDVRNGGIGVLKNFIRDVGKEEAMDIILELANSSQPEIKCFSTTILMALRDTLPEQLLLEVILSLLDDESEESRRCALNAIKDNIHRLARKKKALLEIINKMRYMSEDLFNQFLESVKNDERIYALIQNLLKQAE